MGTDSGTVTITVPNKAPEAGNDEATVELGTIGTIDVLENDSDDNNDVLEITRFSLTSEKGGKNARRGNSLHYTPADGFRGTDSFSYSIDDDNGGTSSATVTITVPNEAPEAGNDSTIVSLGTTGTIQVLANDTDDNNDVLSITGFSLTSEKGGVIARDGNNNSLRYTPANGFRGTDSFEYTIEDGNGGIDSATVTITVTAMVE
ncbi:MAG: tandem-95 repeat protein [Hormoscilla sp. GM102CHS1]|nr:tandem-95 repeat protein [Hormoscilla sp. GM102CHS1]